MSPALAGRVLTTGPTEKSLLGFFFFNTFFGAIFYSNKSKFDLGSLKSDLDSLKLIRGMTKSGKSFDCSSL